MSRNPVVAVTLLAGLIGGAGYFVATQGANHSIGEQIPEQRANLRTQGAQGEAVKAGASVKEAVNKIDKVETHGGDKGLTAK